MTAAPPPNRVPYSWRFLAWWLGGTAAGGLAGGLLALALTGRFLAGLSLGIAAGNVLSLGLYFWRTGRPANAPLPDLNVRLLRWALVVTALGVAAYLAAGWAGVPLSVFFPWDGLGLLALCGLAEALLRRGQSFWASSCLMGGFFLPIAFNAQFYGMSSPVNALYLLGIIISGLVLGSNGFLGALAAISTLTVLFALGEQQGQWVPVYPVGTPAQSAGVVVFWLGVYAAGAWLSWLFARTLERAVHTARGQTQTLAHTLNTLAFDASLEVVLQETLAAISRALEATDAVLWLPDEAGDLAPQLVYVDGQVVRTDHSAPPSADRPVWAALQRDRRPVVVNDPAPGIGTSLYVPLLRQGKPEGFFTVNSRRPRRYSPEDLELAQALATQLALTRELARLAAQDRLAAALNERNRMAREIHDTLAQGFTGIVVQLEAAEDVLTPGNADAAQHLSRARALARESLAEARRSVYALRPQPLEHQPLPAALRASITALTANTPLRLEWHLPAGWPNLPPELEADLLRLGQEAVTNVLRHADARQLRLTLRAAPGQLELEVQDDGRGFDPAANRGGGLGLVGMRERAARHGGELTVTSAPGAGTRVRGVIPMPG